MGQGASQALLTHVIIGAVNVVTTLVAVFTVDRCGPAPAGAPCPVALLHTLQAFEEPSTTRSCSQT